jgi:hypothetical protein
LSEVNLLTVLGVSTVSAAISALRAQCNAGAFSNLALGMYLDLPNFTVGSTNYGTQRIVIAGFNIYSNYNTSNHILFAFKNIVSYGVMNSSSTNSGGYPNSAMHSFLESSFYTGLSNQGISPNSIYRYLSSKGSFSWHSCSVWLPTEYEVFGNVTYGETNVNNAVPISLYNNHTAYRNKGDWWWTASPTASDSSSFVSVDGNGSVNYSNAYDSLGVSPCFCIS